MPERCLPLFELIERGLVAIKHGCLINLLTIFNYSRNEKPGKALFFG